MVERSIISDDWVSWTPLPPSSAAAKHSTFEFIRRTLIDQYGLSLSEVAPILSEVYAAVLIAICNQQTTV